MATTGFSATLTPLRLTLSGPDGENVALVFGRFGANAGRLAEYLTNGGIWKDSQRGINGVLNRGMERVFGGEGAWAGSQRWDANALFYAALKKKHRGHKRVGEDSGALKRSLTDDGAAGAVRYARRDGIEFGSSLPHAEAFDQGLSQTYSFEYFGRTITNRGQPARPLFAFGFQSNVTRDAAKEVQAAFVAKARATV